MSQEKEEEQAGRRQWTYEEFVAVHEGQLLAAAIPQRHWASIFSKLVNEVFDAGQKFQIIVEERGETTIVGRDDEQQQETAAEEDQTIRSRVVALEYLKFEDPENVFLIDHAWTFHAGSARQSLAEVDGLKERLLVAFDIKNPDEQEENEQQQARADQESKNFEEMQEKGCCSPSGVPPTTPRAFSQRDFLMLPKNDSAVSIQSATSAGKVDKFTAIDQIMAELWKHVETYSLWTKDLETGASECTPLWYLPDEFGLRVGRSLEPNARIVPFHFAFNRLAYSLLVLTEDIAGGDAITRPFVAEKMHAKHPDWRAELMLPWRPLPPAYSPVWARGPRTDDYFMSGRIADILPSVAAVAPENTVVAPTASSEVLRVCASDRQLIDQLKRVKIVEVGDPFAADIVWKREHFYDFRALSERSPGTLVNQFPFEATLTVKDLVASAIQAAYSYEDGNEEPAWFKPAYNLDLDLPAFVAEFHRRRRPPATGGDGEGVNEGEGEDNTWIIKPWNLGRGLDIMVTRSLPAIVRQAESGPKIASKYIDRPVLFRRADTGARVKFDLRYIVLVRRFGGPVPEQLDALVYNRFWVRFGVNPFSLADDQLDDPLTHMTVHNYSAPGLVYEMECLEFIARIEEQYPRVCWANVQLKINAVLRAVLEAVSKNPPPRGIAANRQSRAMYGFDVMLEWKKTMKKGWTIDDGKDEEEGKKTADDVQPVFIEANFTPDCERATRYYPDFADTVFESLFLGETPVGLVTRL